MCRSFCSCLNDWSRMARYELKDITLLTDRSMHSNGYAVAVALCEKQASPCYANWYYKFDARTLCDVNHAEGAFLAEVCSMHAAMSVLYSHREHFESACIVFDSDRAYQQITGHAQIERRSGAWDNCEVHVVIYHLCDMMFNFWKKVDCSRSGT